MRKFNSILITGGCGFIGSNYVKYLLNNRDSLVVNVDKLTYAGNLENLKDVSSLFDDRYIFIKEDIVNQKAIKRIIEKYNIDLIVHLAAESHVDRSILGPKDFINTNIIGTFNLLEAVRGSKKNIHFHHVSTDEVFGSLGEVGYFTETTPYSPRSPYSASKASSDHLVMAYFHTYGLNITMSNCSNNYGYYQFPEKLIPLMIYRAYKGESLPIYGDGLNVRDWLFVEDHCEAIQLIIEKSSLGESYNIGGDCEKSNIELVKEICSLLELKLGKEDIFNNQVSFVKDRAGHDRRYAIDSTKIKENLGWEKRHNFKEGINKTVSWYLDNLNWVDNILTGEYNKYFKKNYGENI